MKMNLYSASLLLVLATAAHADFTFAPSLTAGPREDRTDGGPPNSTEGVNWVAFAANRMNGLENNDSVVGTGHATAKWRTGVNYRELITTRTLSMSKLWLAVLGGPSDPNDFGMRTHFGGIATATGGWKININQTTMRIRSIIGPDNAPVFGGGIDVTAQMNTGGYFRRYVGLSGVLCDRLDYGGIGVGFTVNDTTTTIGETLDYCYDRNLRFHLTVTVGGTDAGGNQQTRVFESDHGLNVDDIFVVDPKGPGNFDVTLKDPTLGSAGRMACVESSGDLINWTDRDSMVIVGTTNFNFPDISTLPRQFYRVHLCPFQVGAAGPQANLRSTPFTPSWDVVAN